MANFHYNSVPEKNPQQKMECTTADNVLMWYLKQNYKHGQRGKKGIKLKFSNMASSKWTHFIGKSEFHI
jgi:hypothetical protein